MEFSERRRKRLYARMMEVFAGYGAQVDYEMGRVVDACKQLPGADNTIIIYLAGDNGSSAEGGLEGSLCENMFFNGFAEKWEDNIKVINELGGPKHFNHFPSSWAHAMNAPFQWTKQVASHFGGTRNPMIISWPERIKDKGGGSIRPDWVPIRRLNGQSCEARIKRCVTKDGQDLADPSTKT
jgi:arylsulfatase A-like enzyme